MQELTKDRNYCYFLVGKSLNVYILQAFAYRETMRGNQANDGNHTGRLSCLGCAGSNEGKEAWTSLQTNDFVPMAIRKCYSQGLSSCNSFYSMPECQKP